MINEICEGLLRTELHDMVMHRQLAIKINITVLFSSCHNTDGRRGVIFELNCFLSLPGFFESSLYYCMYIFKLPLGKGGCWILTCMRISTPPPTYLASADKQEKTLAVSEFIFG